jgi:hypothetical protein
VVVVVVVAVVFSACSGDDADGGQGEATTTTVATEVGETSATEPAASGSAADGSTDEASVADSATSVPSVTSDITTSTAPPIVEVPETGVPGLDSDDLLCAAWSRFAGSFQVVAVTAAFGEVPPEQLSALEVAASVAVTRAYDDLLAAWPDELADEEAVGAAQFLGPIDRRLDVAYQSLVDAGADPATLARIEDAWIAALAQRDPSNPEFTIDLPDDVWIVVDAAADDFGGRLVAFSDDPSLITDVATPLTNEYLATSCPDQGTLAGQEIDVP